MGFYNSKLNTYSKYVKFNQKEMAEFQRKILEIDSTAFIVFSESQRIKGNGFYLYK